MNIIKLVCIGDSITEGYEIDQSRRWTNLLSTELGIEIINSGISGDTTAGMLARFYNMVIAHQPSHVIIMGGTNDLWLHLSPEQIIANFHAMSRQAKFNGIETIIGIPPPIYIPEASSKESIFLDDEILSEKMIVFQNQLIKYALADERPCIDFSSKMPEALFMEDGVHPNEAGQEVMMGIVRDVLKSVFI